MEQVRKPESIKGKKRRHFYDGMLLTNLVTPFNINMYLQGSIKEKEADRITPS